MGERPSIKTRNPGAKHRHKRLTSNRPRVSHNSVAGLLRQRVGGRRGNPPAGQPPHTKQTNPAPDADMGGILEGHEAECQKGNGKRRGTTRIAETSTQVCPRGVVQTDMPHLERHGNHPLRAAQQWDHPSKRPSRSTLSGCLFFSGISEGATA